MASATSTGDDDRPPKKPRTEKNNQKTIDELAWKVHLRYNGYTYIIEVRMQTTCGDVLDKFFKKASIIGVEPSNFRIMISGRLWNCADQELRARLASTQGLVKDTNCCVVLMNPTMLAALDAEAPRSDNGEDGEEEDGEEEDGEEKDGEEDE